MTRLLCCTILGLCLILSAAFKAHAKGGLPVSVGLDFGVDWTSIDNYKRTNQTNSTAADNNQSVSEPPGSDADASFQTYIFRLSPVVVVNDSATFNSEITTGYGYGGTLGDSSEQTKDNKFNQALYFHNSSAEAGNSNLTIRTLNMELFSDMGTYTIGRQKSHWGLGAVINDGDKLWDRHSTIRDGVSAHWKIGSFNFIPYWYKIDLTNGLTSGNKASELGISLLYDNSERDLQFGILFGQKKSKTLNTFYQSDIGTTTGRDLGNTKVKITNIFLKKSFGKFSFALEAPIFNGELGAVYNSTDNADYKANGVLLETDYKFNDSWTMGLNAGWLSGDDGENSSGNSTFEAMYLHPNYHIANLMFRYNMEGINPNSGANIFDSSLNNMKYAKLYGTYETNKWLWELAFIWAQAEETAEINQSTFNHQKNKVFTATQTQDDDYGYEIDLNFDYRWNPNVTIQGKFGYFFVGDYWAFNDTATPNETEDSYILLMNAAVHF